MVPRALPSKLHLRSTRQRRRMRGLKRVRLCMIMMMNHGDYALTLGHQASATSECVCFRPVISCSALQTCSFRSPPGVGCSCFVLLLQQCMHVGQIATREGMHMKVIDRIVRMHDALCTGGHCAAVRLYSYTHGMSHMSRALCTVLTLAERPAGRQIFRPELKT